VRHRTRCVTADVELPVRPHRRCRGALRRRGADPLPPHRSQDPVAVAAVPGGRRHRTSLPRHAPPVRRPRRCAARSRCRLGSPALRAPTSADPYAGRTVVAESRASGREGSAMSTATKVPETRDMTGEDLSAEDAWTMLRRGGIRQLLRDAFLRFRYADGFSHARALAFQIVLATIPAVIALFGLSTTLHHEAPGQVLAATIDRITPGAGRPTVRQALAEAQDDARAGGLALWLGLAFAFVSTITAMGQV